MVGDHLSTGAGLCQELLAKSAGESSKEAATRTADAAGTCLSSRGAKFKRTNLRGNKSLEKLAELCLNWVFHDEKKV